MFEDGNVRWGWLKFMYIYTIVGAGGFVLGIIVIPNARKSVFRWPVKIQSCSEFLAVCIWHPRSY